MSIQNRSKNYLQYCLRRRRDVQHIEEAEVAMGHNVATASRRTTRSAQDTIHQLAPKELLSIPHATERTIVFDLVLHKSQDLNGRLSAIRFAGRHVHIVDEAYQKFSDRGSHHPLPTFFEFEFHHFLSLFRTSLR